MTLEERSPLTDSQRLQVQRVNRGRSLGDDTYRNFCSRCGAAMVVGWRNRDRETLMCAGCLDEHMDGTMRIA